MRIQVVFLNEGKALKVRGFFFAVSLFFHRSIYVSRLRREYFTGRSEIYNGLIKTEDHRELSCPSSQPAHAPAPASRPRHVAGRT